MMISNRLRRCWKRISVYYWLALITFSLVIVIQPVIANELSPPSIIEQNSSPPSTLLERGKQQYESGQYDAALHLWQQAAQAYENQGDRINQAICLNYLSLVHQELGNRKQAEQAIEMGLGLLKTLSQPTSNQTLILAQLLNSHGKLQFAQGKTEAALATWQTAERTYASVKDAAGVLGSKINQAQALQVLGFVRRAETILQVASQELQSQPDSALKIAGFRNLGTVLLMLGKVNQAEIELNNSLAIAQRLHLPFEVAANSLSLANTARTMGNSQKALQLYLQTATTAPTSLLRLQAKVNQLSLFIETDQNVQAQALMREIQPQLATLTPSRAGIYVQVNWAGSVLRAYQKWRMDDPSLKQTAVQLANTIQQARQLQDARAESFALGQLGSLYEQTKQQAEAKNLTTQALAIAKAANSPDLAYRWQWQLGRLLKQENDRSGAIIAYREATAILQSLRSDLVAMSPEVQFSFREMVEPVYRELVSLLVEGDTPSEMELQQARQAIEALQLAEIENYIRSACLQAQQTQIEQADASAAIIYPIILADRLTVILSLPGQPLSSYSSLLAKEEIQSTVDQTLESFNPLIGDQQRLRLSQQLYNWLIRPAEAQLSAQQIKTLVFVLDGKLRSLPIAALYDGKQYLIEKYSVAITPGLKLLGPQKPLAKDKMGVLVGALAEARQGFPALPGVVSESQAIASKLTSKLLINQTFTQTELKHYVQENDSPLVHLATHGQFSSNLEKTFILTWDNRLTIEGVRDLLKSRSEMNIQPIELLILSACETAEGDDRAALGLAGLAVRSGARSTLASLWAVNDLSTAELMIKFYQSLTQEGLSKAEALRQSQLEILHNSQYRHPYYWAPFILVGNWL